MTITISIDVKKAERMFFSLLFHEIINNDSLKTLKKRIKKKRHLVTYIYTFCKLTKLSKSQRAPLALDSELY